MKLKYKFVVKSVAGRPVAVAIGDDNTKFNGMVKLNETGEIIFNMLNGEGTSSDAIVKALMDKYSIDEPTAKDAVDGFVDSLRANNLIEE